MRTAVPAGLRVMLWIPVGLASLLGSCAVGHELAFRRLGKETKHPAAKERAWTAY